MSKRAHAAEYARRAANEMLLKLERHSPLMKISATVAEDVQRVALPLPRLQRYSVICVTMLNWMIRIDGLENTVSYLNIRGRTEDNSTAACSLFCGLYCRFFSYRVVTNSFLVAGSCDCLKLKVYINSTN